MPSARARLERLIAAGEGGLRTAFQPIVSLETGDVAGFEALTRPGAETGYPGPAELFADAEREGLLWPLEAIARARCIRAAAEFPEGTLLFFNTTPRTMADARYGASLVESVRGMGVAPGRIVLEVTEAGEHADAAGLAERTRELRQVGFHLAIDDVGAGTSGLNRMMSLRPNWLKLDRELVERVDQDRFKHNLLRFLVHFARLSGVQVIAEGIERREELSTLINLGVGFGQGYVLARPAFAYQTVDAGMRDWLRETWRRAHRSPRSGHAAPGASLSVGALALPTVTVQACAPVSEVAAELLRQPHEAGVVVKDGQRFVGWCPRGVALKAAGGVGGGAAEGGALPISFVTPAGTAAIAPDATITDALELVSVRSDEELAAPVVIADREQVLGMVPLRTLLAAAAGQRGQDAVRVDALTSLPGAVGADQHVRNLIDETRAAGERGGAGGRPGGRPARHTDAAFIDLRDFNAFNHAFGYELGDQLILDLSLILRRYADLDEHPASLTHLGHDRFLLTGGGPEFEPILRAIVKEFDESLGRGPGTLSGGGPGSNAGLSPLVAVGVRVLHVPRAFEGISEPRELFALERQLRVRAAAVGAELGPGRSVFVSDTRRREAAGAVRKAG